MQCRLCSCPLLINFRFPFFKLYCICQNFDCLSVVCFDLKCYGYDSLCFSKNQKKILKVTTPKSFSDTWGSKYGFC